MTLSESGKFKVAAMHNSCDLAKLALVASKLTIAGGLVLAAGVAQAECRYHYEIQGDQILNAEFKCDVARAVEPDEIPRGAIEIIGYEDHDPAIVEDKIKQHGPLVDFIFDLSPRRQGS